MITVLRSIAFVVASLGLFAYTLVFTEDFLRRVADHDPLLIILALEMLSARAPWDDGLGA